MNKIFKFILILVLIFKLNLSAENYIQQDLLPDQVSLEQQIDTDILTEKDKTFLENLVFYMYEKPKEFFLENKKITLGSLLVVSYLLKIVDENMFVLYEEDETKNIFVRKKYKSYTLKDIPASAVKEIDNGNVLPKSESIEEL